MAIFILADSSRVQSYAATVKDAPVVARDADTLVFRDGRVITSDVEGATRT